MQANWIAAIAGALLLGTGIPACAAPEDAPRPERRYEVVNVAPDDSLNIRARPDPSAEIVGRLPAGAADIVIAGSRVAVKGSRWWRVLAPKGPGWVNARYLAPADARRGADNAFPLRCIGTEPFWALDVADGQATLETPADKRSWRAGEMRQAKGKTGRFAIRLTSEDGFGHIAAWRNRAFCSDGMSDIGYPYEGIVAAPGGPVYGGCCMRAGE